MERSRVYSVREYIEEVVAVGKGGPPNEELLITHRDLYTSEQKRRSVAKVLGASRVGAAPFFDGVEKLNAEIEKRGWGSEVGRA